MPRQAHGRSLQWSGPSKPSKRKAAKGRGLDALQIAEAENPEQAKIRQHRLGESYDDDDEPRTRADAEERSSKRRKVTHGDDDEEEQSDSGSDLDGEGWHVGVEEDDEDSDIDSDEAFGESDEERFADFTFPGSHRNAKQRRADQHEGETDSDSDDLGDEGVDLATALDMNELAEQEVSPTKRKDRRRDTSEDDSESADEDKTSQRTEDSEEEMDRDSELSVSDQEEGDHDWLHQFVQSLSAKKVPTKDQAIRKAETAPSKISVADLMQYVKDPQQRQSLKILQNNEIKGPEPYKGGVPGRLAPPLAKRQQDRLDRVAAYDESKKELGKWVETVKQHRRADHLSFPLIDPESAAALNNTQMSPVSQSKPMSFLESKIQEIMQESGLSGTGQRSAEQEERAFEELQEKKVPLAEVQARRAELRMARDLMFREEIRAKRIKKIKSKAFRRIHRKERDRANVREQAERAAHGLVDSDEEREKDDRTRAQERMGARRRESKWAKAAKATGRAAWDEDVRGGVTDLARRDEELRRRVEGRLEKGSDASDSESESDGYDPQVDERDLKDRLAAVEATESGVARSKLDSMAFMKRAQATRKATNDAEVREIRNQLRVDDYEDQPDQSGSDEELPLGRQTFGNRDVGNIRPAREPIDRSEFEEFPSEDDDKVLDLEDTATMASQSTAQPKGKDLRQNQISRDDLQTQKAKSATTQSQRKASKAPAHQPLLATQSRGQTLEAPEPSSSSGFSDQDPITRNPEAPSDIHEAVFFGDEEVLPSFEAEKKEIIVEEDDQALDDPNTLPGWGSWTGAGISKKAQVRSLANLQNRNNKNVVVKGIKPQDRQDAKLDRVIVNEKLIKKNQKYMATELPHPYENRAQYEKSLRVPMGPEWTTKKTFQDGVKPRVLLKQGVIRAVRKPLA